MRSGEPSSSCGKEKSKEHSDLKKAHVLSLINLLLQEFQESPIDSTDFSVPGVIERKLDILVNNLKLLLIENFVPDETKDDFQQMIHSLKEKFKTLNNDIDKIQILTVLPHSWTSSKIACEMGCSEHLAEEAKQLQIQHGGFSRPEN